MQTSQIGGGSFPLRGDRGRYRLHETFSSLCDFEIPCGIPRSFRKGGSTEIQIGNESTRPVILAGLGEISVLPGHQQLLVSMTASDIGITPSHPVISLSSVVPMDLCVFTHRE